MRNFLILSALLSGFIFSSCTEDQKDPVYLHASTKEFFGFQDNSTWTYELSNKPGTEVVYTLSNFQLGVSNPGISQIEFMRYDLNPDSGHKLSLRAEAGGFDPVDRIIFINYNDTGIVYDPIVWNNGNSFTMGDNGTVTMLDSLVVAGKTYKDVLHLKSSKVVFHKEIYYAKGVGIIKRVLENDEAYTVKNYNVIQ